MHRLSSGNRFSTQAGALDSRQAQQPAGMRCPPVVTSMSARRLRCLLILPRACRRALARTIFEERGQAFALDSDDARAFTPRIGVNDAVLEFCDKVLARPMAFLRASAPWVKFPAIAAIGLVCLQQAHPGSAAAGAQWRPR